MTPHPATLTAAFVLIAAWVLWGVWFCLNRQIRQRLVNLATDVETAKTLSDVRSKAEDIRALVEEWSATIFWTDDCNRRACTALDRANRRLLVQSA